MPTYSLSRALRRVCLIPLLLLLPASLPAESRSYDVEILVFEQLRADGGEEGWRSADETRSASGNPPVTLEGGRGIHPVRGAYNLQAIADAMRRSSLYRPLLQARWRQPGWERGREVPVELTASTSDGTRLAGTVSVALSRYLHLNADLMLIDAGNGARTGLHETRRMRSGELHYLDHPRFGILARINPAE